MNYLLLRIACSSILLFIVAHSDSVSANLLGGYTVSDNPKPIAQRRSLSSGSRSTCQSNLDAKDIELSVPSEKVVHLTTKIPSLYLISKKSKVPFKFTLIDPQSTQVLAEKDLIIKNKGLNEINLNPQISLAEGKTYLWYVAFPCQDETAGYYDVLGAAIAKKALTPQAQLDLKKARNSTDRAFVYAQNGFWYDALEETVASISKPPSLEDGRLSKLLESAGIKH